MKGNATRITQVRTATAAGAAALLVCAAAVFGAPEGPRAPGGPDDGGSHFRIKGSVDGLFPGAVQPLTLRVRNPHSFGIVVRKIRVSVSNASPECPASYVAVSRFNGRTPLKARRKRTISLTASMSPLAPDACANATFRLGYRGRATRRR